MYNALMLFIFLLGFVSVGAMLVWISYMLGRAALRSIQRYRRKEDPLSTMIVMVLIAVLPILLVLNTADSIIITQCGDEDRGNPFYPIASSYCTAKESLGFKTQRSTPNVRYNGALYR